MQFYARKYGIKRLGLQPTPSLATSEANGKQAIKMTLLIESLIQSPFANESWTLQDTSADLVLHTEPKETFKKLPYTVSVWFDNDASNAFEYVNFSLIYTRDDNDLWYKTQGQTDYNGFYYEDNYGDKAYFKLFVDEAQRYATSGTWSVHFNNHVLYPPTSSSRPPAGSSVIIIDSDEESTDSTVPDYPGSVSESTRTTYTIQPEKEGGGPRQSPQSSQEAPGIQGQRRPRPEQGEPRSPQIKRAKADSTGGVGRRGARGGGTGGGGGRGATRTRGSPPTAEEVGQRHRTVARRGLTHLERLQEEARDPLLIAVQGPPNALKCWRYRMQKHNDLFEDVTTVFKWLAQTCKAPNGRILISFKSDNQRRKFLMYVKIPKNCTYTFGSLDAL